MSLERCSQEGCEERSAFLFTWPGRDQAGICTKHVDWLRSVSNALGLHLQLIPVASNELVLPYPDAPLIQKMVDDASALIGDEGGDDAKAE